MNKAQSTTEELAESLKRLMLKNSFEKITIKDITNEAGLMRPTFYNHFRDKYDVVEWIFRHDIVEPIYTLIDNNMIWEALRLMMNSIARERPFYQKAMRMEGQNNFYEIMDRVFAEVFIRMYERWLQEAPPDNVLCTPERLAGFFANSLTYMIQEWVEADDRVALDDMIELYRIVFRNALENFA